MESPVKLFISHAHKDQQIARLLVDYLLSEYDLNQREVRCTSIPDYDLAFGELVAEQLRRDVAQPIGFIAVLSHFGLDSAWVKFELGAAWGTRQMVLPILGPKVEQNDSRLGPVNFMHFLMIDDDHCEQKLEKYIRRMATSLHISDKENVNNLEKLKLFVKTYRQFGGENADFSQTRAHILSPVRGITVNRVIKVEMYLAGVPGDGYIWVGVVNTQSNHIWPKESLEDSHDEGERFVEINENGSPEPGTLAIAIIGVGPAGNDMLKDWRRKAEMSGNWSGIRPNEISGYVELARVDQLTLLKF